MKQRVPWWLAPAAWVALGWVVSAGVLAAAPAASAEGAKKADSPAQKVRQALDQPTDLAVENQPLEAALALLAEQTKINFVIDRLIVQQMGVDLQGQGAPVTLKLEQVKVRTALRTLLGQYNLSYAVVGEAVVITSEEMATHRQLRQRVAVDFDKVPLADAVKQLARENAVNLVVDPRLNKEARTPVTVQLDDVPLETAVRLMAETAGLRPVRVGNVLYVTSRANAAELKAELNPNPATNVPPPYDLLQQLQQQRMINLNWMMLPNNPGFIPFIPNNNIFIGR
jgi:type II secretory pathway component GspD/PulD (secretin)